MNYLEIAYFAVRPALLEESCRELERERERQRQFREARAAERLDRPSRFAHLAMRLRRTVQADPCSPAVEGC